MRVTANIKKANVKWQKFLNKMETKERSGSRPNNRYIFWSFIGAFLGIAILAELTLATHTPLIMAPFGATCVLAYGVFDSPLAQPRNIIGGHMISTFIGLVVLHTLGSHPIAMALGVSLAIVVMQLTKTVHPPAGADPLVVLATHPPVSFLILPVAIGAIILVIVALITNNLASQRRYPKYWW
ncbi:HPP family protein [Nostoc sp. WHI]|uniref:HPP family protein n=1 Tax=Nostoc sp. WHI TaxID=2650611 RepID=UPI0018C84FCB|nr:HPP family protein [Nostoc sp. WHI]MBG1265923.1 HPP family protein [Nostoc sp. WHI]